MSHSHTAQHDEIKHNVKDKAQWQRLLYMAVYALMLHIASMAMWILCSLQFLISLLTGSDNKSLRELSATLIEFIQKALNYTSYNSDEKPFPFEETVVAAPQTRRDEEIEDAEVIEETKASDDNQPDQAK